MSNRQTSNVIRVVGIKLEHVLQHVFMHAYS